MKRIFLIMLAALLSTILTAPLVTAKGTVILEDNFDREEVDPSKEQVGNDWGTNSKTRAKGVKQVDLVDGAMHITRAEVADHGVSVTHEAAFKDALITLRFKLGEKDDLGINIADMKEKSVHAGHICMTRIRPYQVQITDLKTGTMRQEIRDRKKAGELTAAEKKQINSKTKTIKHKLKTDTWHDLAVNVAGDTMTVSINGKEVGAFTSEGIGHPTKSRLRLAVGKAAWVDDVKIVKFN